MAGTGWTTSVSEIRSALDALQFCGGGFGSVALTEGLAQVHPRTAAVDLTPHDNRSPACTRTAGVAPLAWGCKPAAGSVVLSGQRRQQAGRLRARPAAPPCPAQVLYLHSLPSSLPGAVTPLLDGQAGPADVMACYVLMVMVSPYSRMPVHVPGLPPAPPPSSGSKRPLPACLTDVSTLIRAARSACNVQLSLVFVHQRDMVQATGKEYMLLMMESMGSNPASREGVAQLEANKIMYVSVPPPCLVVSGPACGQPPYALRWWSPVGPRACPSTRAARLAERNPSVCSRGQT